MPLSNVTPAPTITVYRYQEEGAAEYYEIDDTETVWAMTTLATTA
jgi:hypothetical protein